METNIYLILVSGENLVIVRITKELICLLISTKNTKVKLLNLLQLKFSSGMLRGRGFNPTEDRFSCHVTLTRHWYVIPSLVILKCLLVI